MRLSRKETYARLKKQSRFTRVLAGALAVLMVIYNLSYSGVIWPAFAQEEPATESDVFTLTVKNGEAVVENQLVTVHNGEGFVTKFTEGTTDSNGVVSLGDLTNKDFGGSNKFQFTEGEKTFEKVLEQGTKLHLVWDISNGEVTVKTPETPTNPEPTQPTEYKVNVGVTAGS